MRTCFDPLEITDYRETVFALVRLGEEWAVRGGRPAPDPLTLYCACDFQQFFAGGRLACWSRAALRRLLLDWFPRYCAMPADGWPLVVPSLHRWLDFLGEHHLLDPGGDPPPALHQALDDLATDFPAAMADTSRYGVEKVVVTDLRERGLRPGDPRLFESYLADWHTGRAEAHLARLEQAATVEAAHAGEGRRSPRPRAVWLPADDQLATHARSVPAVGQLLRLTDWIGDTGRGFTKAADLSPVDATELSRFLGLGGPGPTGGADQRPRLAFLLEWARHAGMIRRYGGQLVRVKHLRPALEDPLFAYDRAFTTLFAMRDVILPRGIPLTPFFGWFADVLHDVLYAAYGKPDPGVDLALLGDAVWQDCASRAGFDPADSTRAGQRRDVLAQLGRTVDTLVEAGAARLAGIGPGSGPYLRLTPLGTWSVRRSLRSEGQRAPLVGDLADADADTLLYRLAEDYDTHTGRAEVACWLAARGAAAPDEDDTSTAADIATAADVPTVADTPTMADTPAELAARAELADALRTTPLRTRKALLLHILTTALPERHQFAETLLDSADLGPTAVVVLLDSGHRTMGMLPRHDVAAGVAESMARLLETCGPTELAGHLARQDPRDSADILAAVARSGHPHTERILAAAGGGQAGPDTTRR